MVMSVKKIEKHLNIKLPSTRNEINKTLREYYL